MNNSEKITQLLNMLQDKKSKSLENLLGISSTEVYKRIGQKDTFSELNLSTEEVEQLITDFLNDNEYNNL